MKRIQKTVFSFFLITAPLSAVAQLTIDGEFRTRSIVENGFKTPAIDGKDIRTSVDQRTRLRLNYQTEKYSTRITLQDARIWGSEDMVTKTGPEGNSSTLGVYEAWVDLKLSAHANLIIGRQEWNYNDMRILSSRNFWTSGLSYDGLLLQWQKDGLKLDVGASYNNNGTPSGITVDNSSWETDKLKTMNFMNAQKQIGEKSSVAFMFTLSGKEDETNDALLAMGTHGIYLMHNSGKNAVDGLFGSASAYYQHGTDMKRGTDGNYKDISAYLLAANIGYRTMDKKLELSAGMEYLSGHDYSKKALDSNNTRHTFDLSQSGRIPYYGGYMNHFIIQDSYLVGSKGGAYFDPYIKAKYMFSKGSILEAAFFMPSLASEVTAHTSVDATTGKPSGVEVDDAGNPVYWKGNLGQYLDVIYTHKFSKEIILKGGLSLGAISDIKNQMAYGYKDVANKELNSVDTNCFGWLMLIVKPKFL